MGVTKVKPHYSVGGTRMRMDKQLSPEEAREQLGLIVPKKEWKSYPRGDYSKPLDAELVVRILKTALEEPRMHESPLLFVTVAQLPELPAAAVELLMLSGVQLAVERAFEQPRGVDVIVAYLQHSAKFAVAKEPQRHSWGYAMWEMENTARKVHHRKLRDGIASRRFDELQAWLQVEHPELVGQPVEWVWAALGVADE